MMCFSQCKSETNAESERILYKNKINMYSRQKSDFSLKNVNKFDGIETIPKK